MPKPISALAAYETGQHAWWETAISDIQVNHLAFRGHPIEALIGQLTYAQMAVFMATGRMLSANESQLLEAVLVAGCDHGPRAPSIAAARMAATCGITFNSAVATGVNLLGHYHGGAGEDAMRLFYAWHGKSLGDSTFDLRADIQAKLRRGELLPGFGHQLHTHDPRVAKLLDLAHSAAADGTIKGTFIEIEQLVVQVFSEEKGHAVTANIDGISAAIQCELGLPAEIAQGLFILSRSIGLVAHTFEQIQEGVRVKGPCPPGDSLVRYVGPSGVDDSGEPSPAPPISERPDHQ